MLFSVTPLPSPLFPRRRRLGPRVQHSCVSLLPHIPAGEVYAEHRRHECPRPSVCPFAVNHSATNYCPSKPPLVLLTCCLTPLRHVAAGTCSQGETRWDRCLLMLLYCFNILP